MAVAGDSKGIYNGVIDCFVKTLQHDGMKAFYSGFIPNFARLGSWNVCMFLTLEQVCCRLCKLSQSTAVDCADVRASTRRSFAKLSRRSKRPCRRWLWTRSEEECTFALHTTSTLLVSLPTSIGIERTCSISCVAIAAS